MSVRNCAELGVNLQYVVKRLFANQDFLKLLYYTDKDPLANEDLTNEQIQEEYEGCESVSIDCHSNFIKLAKYFILFLFVL